MDGDLHAALAAVVSADEVVPPGLGERDEVLSTAPVPIRSINSAVVVAGSVDLIHIIHILLIPERDLVIDIESVVVGPESVVDVWVPASVLSNDVVSGRAEGEEEEENKDEWRNCV
eukprot:TRINITY_DN81896_c0_g1_i1.p2 TRINITY_DN81896_c0_g1~~TRINITY_DN81896_c0_g1_i1.p2  ORF type:complete len:116 (-),score=20.81 TRINITY_DN81896_c0_g1_i1:175-522(-)